MPPPFYGADQAFIHHTRFGDLASSAAALLIDRLRRAGHTSGTVVDLGSGSGILARTLSDAGYRVHGFDISPAMVELAREQAPTATFSVGSLHDADIPSAVAVTAVGEGLNYATDARAGLDALGKVVLRAHEALLPGGVLLFDVSTPGRGGPEGSYERFHDGGTWVLHMRAQEHPDTATLEKTITIFRDDGDGAYRRTDERHVLRLYDPVAVEGVLVAAGFDVEVRPGYADEPTPSVPPGSWAVFVATRPA